MKGLEYFAHVNSVDDPICRRQISKWSVALIRSYDSCTILLSRGCPAYMSSLLSKTILKSPAKRHLWLSLFLFSTFSSSLKNSLSSFGPYTLTTTYASPLCINEMTMMRSWLISTLTPDISIFRWVRITCPLLWEVSEQWNRPPFHSFDHCSISESLTTVSCKQMLSYYFFSNIWIKLHFNPLQFKVMKRNTITKSNIHNIENKLSIVSNSASLSASVYHRCLKK